MPGLPDRGVKEGRLAPDRMLASAERMGRLLKGAPAAMQQAAAYS
jgi:hypothetical protein